MSNLLLLFSGSRPPMTRQYRQHVLQSLGLLLGIAFLCLPQIGFAQAKTSTSLHLKWSVTPSEQPLTLMPLHQLSKNIGAVLDVTQLSLSPSKTWTSAGGLHNQTLDLTSLTSSASPKTTPQKKIPKRVYRLKDDSRVFWYAMGASALASLATRFLSIGPAVFVLAGLLFATAAVPPLVTLTLLGALFAGYLTLDAAIAALAGTYVFDSISQYYRSSFISAFMGQMLGNAVAVSAVGLMVGFGIFYISGVNAMAQFLTADFTAAVGVFSSIGLMPVFIVGLFVSIALPAIAGAWGLSVAAQPKAKLATDPSWKLSGKRFPITENIRLQQMLPEHRRKIRLPTAFSLVIPGT